MIGGDEPERGQRDSSWGWVLARAWVAAVILGYLAITVLGSSTVRSFLAR